VVAEASPIQDDAVHPVRFYPATLAFAEFEVGGGGCDGGPPSPPPHQCSNGEEEELVEIRVYAGAPPASTDWERLWERGPADLATAATPVAPRSSYGWRVEDGDTGEVVWECGGGGSSNFGDPPPEAGEGEPCGGREYGVRVDRACLPKRGCRRFVFGQPDPAPMEGPVDPFWGIKGSGRYNPRFEVRVDGKAVFKDDSATYRAAEWGACSSPTNAAGADGDCGALGSNSSSSLLEIFRYQDPGFALSFALRDARTGELVAASDPGATGRRNSSASSSSAGLQYERLCVRSSQCYTLTLDRDPRTTQTESTAGQDGTGNTNAADVRVLLDGVYLLNGKMHELDPVDGKRFERLVVPLGNCAAESLCHDDSVGSSRDKFSSSSSVVVVRWDTSLASLHRPYYLGSWRWLTLDAGSSNNPFNDGDGRDDRESYRHFGNGFPPGGAFLYQACVPRRGESLVFGMTESVLYGANSQRNSLSWTIEKDGVPLECQYQFPPGDYSRSPFAHLLGYVVTPLDGSCPPETAGGAPPATAGAVTAAGGFSTLAAAAAAVLFTLLVGTRRIRRRRVDSGPSDEEERAEEEEEEEEEDGSDEDGEDVVSGGDLTSNGEPIDRSTAPLLRS
jgi:hypothetical protein